MGQAGNDLGVGGTISATYCVVFANALITHGIPPYHAIPGQGCPCTYDTNCVKIVPAITEVWQGEPHAADTIYYVAVGVICLIYPPLLTHNIATMHPGNGA